MQQQQVGPVNAILHAFVLNCKLKHECAAVAGLIYVHESHPKSKNHLQIIASPIEDSSNDEIQIVGKSYQVISVMILNT